MQLISYKLNNLASIFFSGTPVMRKGWASIVF